MSGGGVIDNSVEPAEKRDLTKLEIQGGPTAGEEMAKYGWERAGRQS
jgi:hypothetical protein